MDSLSVRVDYIEKSIEKNDKLMDRRLEYMNEFRQALKDQNQTFITRSEYDAKHELLDSKIELNRERTDADRDADRKLIYMGVGGLLALELLLRFVK